MIATLTDATREAQQMLRTGATFQWSTITLLLLAVYVYAVEIEARRFNVVLAGLAFWLWDWFNEIVNSLILHWTGHSALWTIGRHTSYLILIGLCIEITLMFLILPIAYVKTLPKDRAMRILGVPNRWFFIVVASIASVMIEVVLHAAGALRWEYWFWNWPCIPLIVLFGYMPFYWVATVVYDLADNRAAQLKIVGAEATVVVTMLLLFGPILNLI